MRLLAGAGCALWLALTPAAAFDLADWTRRSLPNSPTVFFDCVSPRACGDGSAVSARLQPLGALPSRLDEERRRQQGVAQRMRQQMAERVADVDIDDTREQTIEGLRAFVTQKAVAFRDGRRQAYIDAVLFGPTRAYSVIASGSDPAQVRRNFEGYTRLVALMLEELAAADRGRVAPPQRSAPPPHAPPQQRPSRPPPRPQGPPPSARTAPPPPPQARPPAQHQPPADNQEPPYFEPPPGHFDPPPTHPQTPPANFPPPPQPPR